MVAIGKWQVAKDPPWDIMFLFAIWLIWNQQNHVVFKNNSPNPRITKEIARQAMEFFHCADRFKNPKIMITRPVHWEKPDPGWMKLNTDAVSNSSLGIAGGGGLLRDDAGNWVMGFARKIGKADSFLAELWELRDGLLLCQQMNLTAIVIELDAKAIVDAFTNPTYSNSIFSTLFDDCRQLVIVFPSTTSGTPTARLIAVRIT